MIRGSLDSAGSPNTEFSAFLPALGIAEVKLLHDLEPGLEDHRWGHAGLSFNQSDKKTKGTPFIGYEVKISPMHLEQ